VPNTVSIVPYLGARPLTEGQIKTLQNYATKISKGLEIAGADFTQGRMLIETLSRGSSGRFTPWQTGEPHYGLHRPTQSSRS
jgi:hypothetical protein